MPRMLPWLVVPAWHNSINIGSLRLIQTISFPTCNYKWSIHVAGHRWTYCYSWCHVIRQVTQLHVAWRTAVGPTVARGCHIGRSVWHIHVAYHARRWIPRLHNTHIYLAGGYGTHYHTRLPYKLFSPTATRGCHISQTSPTLHVWHDGLGPTVIHDKDKGVPRDLWQSDINYI